MSRIATVYDYATLCQQVQQVNVVSGDALRNWQCILSESLLATDFCAAAYQNVLTGEVVIVYRGTLPSSSKNLISDYEIFRNRRPDTFQAAFAFYQKIIADRPDALIAITGFSLGAVLAELTAFEFSTAAKVIPTITFDSPGIKPLINEDQAFRILHMNVTTYMAKPHLINTCNEHIGQLFQIDLDKHLVEHLSSNVSHLGAHRLGGELSFRTAEVATKTLSEHSIDKFVEALHPEANNVIYLVKSWPSWLANIAIEILPVLFKIELSIADNVLLRNWYHKEPILRTEALKLSGHQETPSEIHPVDIEPIVPDASYISQVNSDFTFDTDLWVISILNTGSKLGGHAVLVVEGIQGDKLFVGQYDIRAVIDEEPSSSLSMNRLGHVSAVNMREADVYGRPGGYDNLSSRSFHAEAENFQHMRNSILADLRRTDIANVLGIGHLRYQTVGSDGILHTLFGSTGAGINCAQWCLQKLKCMDIDLGKTAEKKRTPEKATMTTGKKLVRYGVVAATLATLSIFAYRKLPDNALQSTIGLFKK